MKNITQMCDVISTIGKRGDELKTAIKMYFPTLAADMEWSIAESGKGALLLEGDRIFAEIIVSDSLREGFGLFLEDKITASETDVWLNTADEVVMWICDQIGDRSE